ncbi:flavonol 3-O-glucosyltransferase UGT89B1 [Dendrobium catenatum]|uniref:UDP-glycosyltransferase 89B1 n=1 Tax=Dendrobium catenatum TaxID=906689 RepID=A0A2I0WSP8_9ASPA|nr:flavonol 3-O-glucosyltransferase UGT89B1 [Dendrobium catenatum]PKU78671.1 UDP-glycosyltransferase 89B1 [Dendrobium catenatum]
MTTNQAVSVAVADRRPLPHLLVFPFPAQGHLLPLLHLSTHLATRFAFSITVIITPKNLPLIQPFLSSSSQIHPLVLPLPPSSSLPSGAEHIRTLPDGTPSAALIHALSSLRPSILRWAKSQSNPPSALISDFFLGWCVNLAADLQISHVSFFSVSALLAAILHPLFLSLPPPSSTPVSVSPSLPSFPFPHLPSVFRRYVAGNPDWDFTRESFLSNSLSSAAIFDTFDFFDSHYLSHLRSSSYASGRLFAVGPIPPAVPESDNSNIFPYLDSCPPNSVVYICFGSQFTTEPALAAAISAGLESSGVRFVWAVGTAAPEEFNGKGKVVKGWVPQRAVLEHVAVAAFVTHCGWNSVLEGLVAGVLLLAWPMEADQFVNAKLLVEDAGVAVRICEGGPGKVPEAAELGRLIGEAVEEGSWPALRLKAAEMARKAKEAVAEGGSSFLAMEEMVKLLKQATTED